LEGLENNREKKKVKKKGNTLSELCRLKPGSTSGCGYMEWWWEEGKSIGSFLSRKGLRISAKSQRVRSEGGEEFAGSANDGDGRDPA
jgi:hypothetical protein